MKSPIEGARQWSGVNRHAAKINLPSKLFQIDHGSDRYRPGSWRRRRGMRHTSLPKYGSAVTTIIGLDLPGVDLALLVAEGANAQGNLNVVEQTVPAAGGFGVDGFGTGGFGA